MMQRPISVGFIPTIERDDILVSLKLLFRPWQWKKYSAVRKLEDFFKNFFSISYASAFNSGRSAELAILRALAIGKGDHVLIQGFTCVAVPNSILWVGAKPIYVDTKINALGMDERDLEKKITSKAKAIIVQHTFGISDDMNKILAVAKRHKLFLIEDCAHALGGNYGGRKLGTWGDAAFFSFGRDKVVSSVFGGMTITQSEVLGKKIADYQRNLDFPSYIWIAKQLIYPLLISTALPIYEFFSLGKVIIELAKRTFILVLPVSEEEKKAGQPAGYPRLMAAAQAEIALNQLAKLGRFTDRRKQIAKTYRKYLRNLPLQPVISLQNGLIRYPVLLAEANKFLAIARRQGIILGRWYEHLVDPQGTDLSAVGYKWGDCPNAESMAKRIVNLPTSPVLSDAEIMKVIKLVNQFYDNN